MNEPTKQTRVEKLLLEAGRTFNSTLEYEELNELVLKLVIGAVESEAAMIYRSDPGRVELRTRFMACGDCEMITIDREPRAGVVGWVLEHCEPVIINDAANEPQKWTSETVPVSAQRQSSASDNPLEPFTFHPSSSGIWGPWAILWPSPGSQSASN